MLNSAFFFMTRRSETPELRTGAFISTLGGTK